jgi:hypothetical protein
MRKAPVQTGAFSLSLHQELGTACCIDASSKNNNGHGEMMRVHPASSFRHRDRFRQRLVPPGWW